MWSFLKAGILASLVVLPTTAVEQVKSKKCRCFPGDACWPSNDDWSQFNITVGGGLVRTVPVGSVCHDPNYDADACEALRKTWNDPATHLETSHSPMMPLFVNDSCSPFTDRTAKCEIGAYVQFAVKVSSAGDVQNTIDFAKARNIRLVIRNTGHDYLGKSTGAGAIAIWTQHLKGIEWVDWNDAHYQGKSIKLQAGVLAGELMDFAAKDQRVAITGNCPTTGPAGGYIQGGGHSPLSSRHGLAADAALQFEVIDGKGQYLVADRNENADLFWALRGGGGGTYAVVLSVTVKTFPNEATTLATVEFARGDLSLDRFHEAVAVFTQILPSLVDAGCFALWTFNKDGFSLAPMNCVGSSAEETEGLLKPFLGKLDEWGIPFKKLFVPFDRYTDFFQATWSFMEKNSAGTVAGGSWFTPRAVVTDTNRNQDFIKAAQAVADAGASLFHLSFSVAGFASAGGNAVHPEYRNMVADSVISLPLNNSDTSSTMLARHQTLTDHIIPLLQKVAPEAGTYLNEADPFDPNWKVNFYGSNYAKLLEIKDKYDPEEVFYARTAVGSDRWVETPDFHLCRVRCAKHQHNEL